MHLAYRLKSIKVESGKMEWSRFSIKILGVNFGNSILDNSHWGKISEDIVKKIHI